MIDPVAPSTSSTPSAAIDFRRVTKRFGDKIVVENLDLALPRGAITVILGPSGTGKSTLLRMATGLLRPDGGAVLTLGVDVFGASHAELFALRRRIGMLFQDNALFTSLSVFDNVAFPLRKVGRVGARETTERVEALLEQVGLAGLGDRLPDRLSGGQRKRVALARALALSPELVLFDEPTSGLDPQTSASIDELVRATHKRLGTTFVVITHDVTSAAVIADKVGFLKDGALRAFGDRAAVWQSDDPAVRAFLDRKVA